MGNIPQAKYINFFRRKEQTNDARGITMAFECNIDARGKVARLKLGIRLLVLGLILGALTLFGVIPTTLGWVITGGAITGAIFVMWEARMGWCVVRAMGVRTKI